MTEYHFETLRPASLYVEIGKGSVQVVATDTTESYVELTGRDAADVRVTQDADEITVVAPRMRTGFLSGDSRLDVRVTVPTDSDLAIRTGSADIRVDGTVGTAKLKSGSGEVLVDTLAGPAVLETGSTRPAASSASRAGRAASTSARSPPRSPSRPVPATSRSAPRTARPSSRPARATSRSPTPGPTSRSPPAAATS